jgi:hypothetical protein
VSAYGEHVEVDGMSIAEVERAIELYQRVTHAQVQARSALSVQVHQAFLEEGVSLVSSATQKQVRRSAALREHLLREEGFETYSTLADKRGTTETAARTWVSRRRERHELFTVELQGRTLIPAVQLTAKGAADPVIAEILRPLLHADAEGWGLWAWLTSPTSRLSGETPARVARVSTRRAYIAAERYAQELRLAQDAPG